MFFASISSFVEWNFCYYSICIASFFANSSAYLRAYIALSSNSILAFNNSFSFCLVSSFILSPWSSCSCNSCNFFCIFSYSFFKLDSALDFSFSYFCNYFFSSSCRVLCLLWFWNSFSNSAFSLKAFYCTSCKASSSSTSITYSVIFTIYPFGPIVPPAFLANYSFN